MNLRVLIASPNKAWSQDLIEFMNSAELDGEHVSNGKDAQLLLYKEKVYAALLDADLENHNAFEVVRYIKANRPLTPIILYFSSKDRFKALDIPKKDLIKIGISDILINPITHKNILSSIQGLSKSEAWIKLKPNQEIGEEEDVEESDSRFTQIPINEICMSTTAIFDLYVRVKKNHYIKILRKGDYFERKRILKYKQKGASYLYFKTNDRVTFINYMNEIIDKIAKSERPSGTQKLNLLKNTADKVLESIETEGLEPKLVEESKKLCKSFAQMIDRDKRLSLSFKKLQEVHPEVYSHTFLVSFFSAVICKNISWSTSRTLEIVAFASLVHDIGKLKLNPSIVAKRPKEMNEEELSLYKKHPEFGLEMLQDFNQINEQTRQVIFQHHENCDGSGFPNGLVGTRIFPLAKILNVADKYAHTITDNKLSPLKALEKMVLDKDIVKNFDRDSVRALLQAFISK